MERRGKVCRGQKRGASFSERWKMARVKTHKKVGGFEEWKREWKVGSASSAGVGFKLWAAEHGWSEVARTKSRAWKGVTEKGESVLVWVVKGREEALAQMLMGRRVVRSGMESVMAGVRVLLWSPDDGLEVGKELVTGR